MGVPTFAAVPLDQVFTRFSFNKIGGSTYKDSRYKNRPFLKLLREKKLTGDGGPNIVHPVNLGTSFNGKSLARNETFTITGDSNETWSQWRWKVLIETCFVSWWDIREARGNQYKMASILSSRIDETGENMEEQITTQLSQTTKVLAKDLTTILEIVKSTGAIGGMDPANAGQAAWAAEVEDTINWSVEGVGRARELYTKITDNKGEVDAWLLPVAFYNETLEIGDAALVMNQDAKTKGGTKYADLGMQVPLIMSKPVIHDPMWDTYQTATGVGLDLSDIHLVVDPQWDMYMWPFKEMVHHGQLGQASAQVEVAELTCSRRRTQGLLSTIS